MFQSPLLQSIGGTFDVTGNPNLRNLTLPSLRTIGGGLRLYNNTNLTTINQIEGLIEVGGAVEVVGPVSE